MFSFFTCGYMFSLPKVRDLVLLRRIYAESLTYRDLSLQLDCQWMRAVWQHCTLFSALSKRHSLSLFSLTLVTATSLHLTHIHCESVTSPACSLLIAYFSLLRPNPPRLLTAPVSLAPFAPALPFARSRKPRNDYSVGRFRSWVHEFAHFVDCLTCCALSCSAAIVKLEQWLVSDLHSFTK